MHTVNPLIVFSALAALPWALAKPTSAATASCPHGRSYYLYHKLNSNRYDGNGSYAYLEASGYYVGTNDNDTSYYIQFGVDNPSQAVGLSLQRILMSPHIKRTLF